MARGTGCPKESDEGKPVRELTGLSGDVDKKAHAEEGKSESRERKRKMSREGVCVWER